MIVSSVLFRTILLVLPLLGIKITPIGRGPIKTIISDTLGQQVKHIATDASGFVIAIKPENTCVLPFSKPTCLLTRFGRVIHMEKYMLVGPFTGHLAINRVIGLNVRFEGAPVSRNSATAVVVLESTHSNTAAGGIVLLGQGMSSPRIRPVGLPCEGMYAVDVMYSGIDPALGRVWHRSVISLKQGQPVALFSTGGFSMGPTGAFSAGPSYWFSQPFSNAVHLTAWGFDGCKLLSTSLDLSRGHSIRVHSVLADLDTNQKSSKEFDIKSPLNLDALKSKNPVAIAGWLLAAGRMLRLLPVPVLWWAFKAEWTFVTYSLTELPLNYERVRVLWLAEG